MKRLFFVAALCGAVMLAGCMETTYQNKKTNNNSTTTTTTTTTDENGNTTTTTTTDDSGKKQVNKNFHSPNGKFYINFLNIPDGPIVKEETNKAGMVQVVQYIDQLGNDGLYIAMYKDYPVGAIKEDEVNDKLKLEATSAQRREAHPKSVLMATRDSLSPARTTTPSKST